MLEPWKLRIIMQLMREHVQYKQKRAAQNPMSTAFENEKDKSFAKNSTSQPRILVEAAGKNRVRCFCANCYEKNSLGDIPNFLVSMQARDPCELILVLSSQETFYETTPWYLSRSICCRGFFGLTKPSKALQYSPIYVGSSTYAL